MLFPGGEGRLVLTDPDDMLTTGIEVEARPPGKKVKRLSLLSGGERSLTAVALLVAIFRARPSPFYVMDEVEAALDDINLGRLLTLLDELRESSQLIVITHQKRTMEIADALYGVTDARRRRHPGDQPAAHRTDDERPTERGEASGTGTADGAPARLRRRAAPLGPGGGRRHRAGVRPAAACSVRSPCTGDWLQPVLTGQVSHADWVSSVADALTESVAGTGRGRRCSSGRLPG